MIINRSVGVGCRGITTRIAALDSLLGHQHNHHRIPSSKFGSSLQSRSPIDATPVSKRCYSIAAGSAYGVKPSLFVSSGYHSIHNIVNNTQDESSEITNQEFQSLMSVFNLPRNAIIVLALSGGPDSMALYLLLKDYIDYMQSNKNADMKLFTVTIDHKLRDDSTEEANLVKQYVQSHDYSQEHTVIPINWEIPIKTSGKKSLLARIERYKALLQFSQEKVTELLYAENQKRECYILTAHHEDDNIETMVMRCNKGTEVFGLRGISKLSILFPKPEFQHIHDDGENSKENNSMYSWISLSDTLSTLQRLFLKTNNVNYSLLIRPLLNIPKKRLIATCDARNQKYCIDPSNADTSNIRNKIRSDLDNYYKANPGVGKALMRSVLYLANKFVMSHHAQEEHLTNTFVEFNSTFGFVTIAREVFSPEYDIGIQRRVLAKCIAFLGIGTHKAFANALSILNRINDSVIGVNETLMFRIAARNLRASKVTFNSIHTDVFILCKSKSKAKQKSKPVIISSEESGLISHKMTDPQPVLWDDRFIIKIQGPLDRDISFRALTHDFGKRILKNREALFNHHCLSRGLPPKEPLLRSLPYLTTSKGEVIIPSLDINTSDLAVSAAYAPWLYFISISKI